MDASAGSVRLKLAEVIDGTVVVRSNEFKGVREVSSTDRSEETANGSDVDKCVDDGVDIEV